MLGRPYKVYPWIRYVEGEILDMLARPDNEILIVNIPPQQGKTTYAGMWLPFWYLGLNPEDLIIFVAYNEEYASTWGRNVRDLVDRFGASLFGIGLNKSLQPRSATGARRAASGGCCRPASAAGITGNPGHFIIIDDVIKGMEDAYSPTLKRNHLREWDGSISARMQNNTKVSDHRPPAGPKTTCPARSTTRSIAEPTKGSRSARSASRRSPNPTRKKSWRCRSEQPRGVARRPRTQARARPLQGQHRPLFFQRKRGSVDTFAW